MRRTKDQEKEKKSFHLPQNGPFLEKQAQLNKTNSKALAMHCLLYTSLGSDVFCNMVEGRIIYRKDQGTLWQEEEVMTTAQQTAEKIWQRLVPLVEN